MEQAQKDLRRLQQRLQKQQQRRVDGTLLSRFTLQTAMLIALLLQYDFTAAAIWVQTRRRRGSQIPEGMAQSDVREMIENAFLAADDHELASWTDSDSSPLPANVRKTAAKFVREYQLATWVQNQNNSKGIAVPSQLLVSEYNKLVKNSDWGIEGVPEIATSSWRRVWASRWRAKFGGRHMRLRLEEPVGLEERRSKVARKSCLQASWGAS